MALQPKQSYCPDSWCTSLLNFERTYLYMNKLRSVYVCNDFICRMKEVTFEFDNDVWTCVDIVYATRIDCSIMQLETAF